MPETFYEPVFSVFQVIMFAVAWTVIDIAIDALRRIVGPSWRAWRRDA